MATNEGKTGPEIGMGGWTDKGGGWIYAKPWQTFPTPEYQRFAEANRARWDLFEFVKVKFIQRLRRIIKP